MTSPPEFSPICTVGDFLNAVHDFRDALLLRYRVRDGEVVFRELRDAAKADSGYLDGMPILLKLTAGNANRPRFVGIGLSQYVLNIRYDGTFSLPYAECSRDRVWNGLVIEALVHLDREIHEAPQA